MDEVQMIEIVEKAYEKKGTKDITEKELLGWLHSNCLTPEEADKAINVAIKQHKIRFCYVSSRELGSHIPCYEKLTEEDLKFEEELREEMHRRTVQKEAGTNKTKQRGRKKKINEEVSR